MIFDPVYIETIVYTSEPYSDLYFVESSMSNSHPLVSMDTINNKADDIHLFVDQHNEICCLIFYDQRRRDFL